MIQVPNIKEKTPFVSVIVPIYNVEKYLEQCLDSLLGQTLINIEIIAVNDGSTDNSPQILDRYAEQYPQIKAFYKPNGGLSDARNFGIDKSTANYICFVDSDDWVDSTMMEEMYEKAIDTNSDIVVCAAKNHYEEKDKITNLDIRGKLLDYGHSVAEKPNILWSARSYAWNKIFNRRLFDNNKHRFPVGQWYEDSSVIYNLLFDANKVSCMPKRFYHYRREREGAITTKISLKVFDIFKSCDSIINFFYTEKKIDDPSLDKVIEKLFRAHIFVRYDLLWSSSKNKKLAWEYTKYAFSYMDKHFPGWQKRYKIPNSQKKSLKALAKKNKNAAFLYIYTPKIILKLLSKPIRVLKRSKKRYKVKKEKKLLLDRKNRLQLLGASFLNELDAIFDSVEVNYFLDDETLLWFVRQGNFNPDTTHSTIGVFATQEQKLNIHAAFLDVGYKLWKEYLVDGKDVGQFYYYHNKQKPSVHIKFYENENNCSYAWSFYNNPEIQYGPKQQSVCKMQYSNIDIAESIQLKDRRIPTPRNPEKFLSERYDKDWDSMDEDIYCWQSPVAKTVDRYGYFADKYMLPEDVLRKLQLELLEMLDIFEGICKKHTLTYYLSEGTLLGAVRHKGFIPWDDDIDISMPRKDYELLLALSESEWYNNKLSVWTSDTDPDYHLVISKIVGLHNTEFKNIFPPNVESQFSGPAIDIFPLDGIPFDHGPKIEKMGHKIRTLRNMILLKADYPIRKSKRNKRLIKFAKLKSNSSLQKQVKDLTTSSNKNPNNPYIINWSSSYHYSKQVVPKETYGEPIMLEYEGKLRPCPSQYDYLLKKIYGDYMKLPDEENRVNKTHFTIYDSRRK